MGFNLVFYYKEKFDFKKWHSESLAPGNMAVTQFTLTCAYIHAIMHFTLIGLQYHT